MAKNNYYAVRKGRKTGIFTSWNECAPHVKGFSGAEYKGFPTLEDACAWLHGKAVSKAPKAPSKAPKAPSKAPKAPDTEPQRPNVPKNTIVCYTDGSYHPEYPEYFASGMVLFEHDNMLKCKRLYHDPEFAKLRNVAGELNAAKYALYLPTTDRSIRHVIIYHDYQGIADWCTGAWKAKNAYTKAYKDAYDRLVASGVTVEFKKIKSHTGDYWNELADQLANQAYEQLSLTETNKLTD